MQQKQQQQQQQQQQSAQIYVTNHKLEHLLEERIQLNHPSTKLSCNN